MEVYLAGDKWVLGLKGGMYEDLCKEPEAVILTQRPIPNKKWETPTVTSDIDKYGDYLEYDYTFQEFLGDDSSIFMFRIDFRRRFSHGIVEYFMAEDYAKEKIEFLRNKKSIAEFHWHIERQRWVEVERLFKYEDEDEYEN